jgi:uncharacterized DUF497 family protein
VFEWDERKATINLAKHNVSFEEALTIFGDPNAFDARAVARSTHEPRRLRLGMSAAGRVLTVVYTLRSSDNGEAIRIISARPANREKKLGYAGTQD